MLMNDIGFPPSMMHGEQQHADRPADADGGDRLHEAPILRVKFAALLGHGSCTTIRTAAFSAVSSASQRPCEVVSSQPGG